jgi:hypothetical protein
MVESAIECLKQQVECYRRLAGLAELQHVHVKQDQTEALLDVLQSRREMLDEIRRLEQTTGPATQQWRACLVSIESADRERAEALLAETRELLEQITESDRNDMLVLQQRKLNLGRQINQAMASRVSRTFGAAAYGSGCAAAPGMDVKR